MILIGHFAKLMGEVGNETHNELLEEASMAYRCCHYPLVRVLKAPGVREVQWDASTVPSGVYFVQMQAGDFRQVRKVMVLK